MEKYQNIKYSKPLWEKGSCTQTEWSLHQIAPYIGKCKSTIASSLIKRYSEINHKIADPFCGSGGIVLEAAANNRIVFAGDTNPYAYVLTKAKLEAPLNLQEALINLENCWKRSRYFLPFQDLRKVPSWVRNFFHPNTLKNALAFRDACVEYEEHFLLSCLLGILHHQRNGFLSKPSSHLVPYLKDKQYPIEKFPALYQERDVYSRLFSKITRTYKRMPRGLHQYGAVHKINALNFPVPRGLQLLITSPPYMNQLDYVRDNRLRLWFINKELPNTNHKYNINTYRALIEGVCRRFGENINSGGYIILILGGLTEGTKFINTSDITCKLFNENVELRNNFTLEKAYIDNIPDIRRSRKNCKSIKEETILVYRKI